MLYSITPSIFFRYLRYDIIALSSSAWGAAFERDADGDAGPDASAAAWDAYSGAGVS